MSWKYLGSSDSSSSESEITPPQIPKQKLNMNILRRKSKPQQDQVPEDNSILNMLESQDLGDSLESNNNEHSDMIVQ